ncbi:MAG: hypothetical protein ACI867_001345 [Glaciecola sp.]|jgi:hypothetical protein
MQLVMSQGWTKDEGLSADAYVAASAAMQEFLEAQPGFIRRELVRGVEDRTHFINLRWFETVEHYLAITALPAYPDLLASLAEHLDLRKYEEFGYPREFLDVVLG